MHLCDYLCLIALTLASAARTLHRPLARPAPRPRARPAVATALSEVELAAMVERWQSVNEAARARPTNSTASSAASPLDQQQQQHRLQYARARLKQLTADARDYSSDADADGAAVPLVSYDPDAAAARFASSPVAVARRQVQLIAPLALFLGRVALDTLRGQEAAQRRRRAQELTALIASLGPATVKVGQALASRSDLMPTQYLSELQKLQDRVPPFPSEEAFDILSAELRAPLSQVYSEIGEAPVAAASLGQVYRARLRSTGDEVAVKVQRPGVEASVAMDLHIFRSYSHTLAGFSRLLGREIDLRAVLDDFGRLIYREMDYGVEADSCRRFGSLYGGLPNVTAPTVHPAFSTRRVLTMQVVAHHLHPTSSTSSYPAVPRSHLLMHVTARPCARTRPAVDRWRASD